MTHDITPLLLSEIWDLRDGNIVGGESLSFRAHRPVQFTMKIKDDLSSKRLGCLNFYGHLSQSHKTEAGMIKGILQDTWWLSTEQLLIYSSTMCQYIMLFIGSLQKSFLRLAVTRQHCRLTICIELVELTNSETAAATPPGEGAKTLRRSSSIEN